MRVEILLFDGFHEADPLGVYEVLATAAALGAAFRVEWVRLGSGTVTSAFGLQLHVPRLLEPESRPDLLVVPGGGWIQEAGSSGWAAGQRARIASSIGSARAAGVALAAVREGVLLCADAGAVSGRAFAGAAIPTGEELGGQGIAARVVDDGELLTASGSTAGLDLALWLVERESGPELAHRLESRLQHERRGTVWRRAGAGPGPGGRVAPA